MENDLKELFFNFVKNRIEERDNVDEALDSKILDIDFVFNLTGPADKASDDLFAHIYGEEALDWVSWWLYEKNCGGIHSPLEAYDKDGKVIPTDTIEDLWNLINSENCK